MTLFKVFVYLQKPFLLLHDPFWTRILIGHIFFFYDTLILIGLISFYFIDTQTWLSDFPLSLKHKTYFPDL